MNRRIKISLPASRAREMARGAGEIENYVREILPLVEEDIEDALENEKNYAITPINTNFEVQCMSNREAQRDVYYLLAQVLIKAGYYPEYVFRGKKAESQQVYIITRWKSSNEREADDYKSAFLRQITRTEEPTKQTNIRRSKQSSRM